MARDDELLPYTLTWREVDPAARPFDPREDIAALVRPMVPWPVDPARDRGYLAAWQNEVTRALHERYGRWAVGWRWAADEGELGGGPVHAWCCTGHSLTTLDETSARIQAALREWRGWLEVLAARFEELAPRAPDAGERRAAFERAVPVLIADVVERTSAGDAWYNHCAQVLEWYLARTGVADARARELVDEALRGRFESWIAPDEATIAALARAVADRAGPTG